MERAVAPSTRTLADQKLQLSASKRRSMRSKAVGGVGVDAQAVGRGGRSAGEGAAQANGGAQGQEAVISGGFLVGRRGASTARGRTVTAKAGRRSGASLRARAALSRGAA